MFGAFPATRPVLPPAGVGPHAGGVLVDREGGGSWQAGSLMNGLSISRHAERVWRPTSIAQATAAIRQRPSAPATPAKRLSPSWPARLFAGDSHLMRIGLPHAAQCDGGAGRATLMPLRVTRREHGIRRRKDWTSLLGRFERAAWTCPGLGCMMGAARPQRNRPSRLASGSLGNPTLGLGCRKGMFMGTPGDSFDPIDHEFMRLRGRMSPEARLQAMLAAREWVVSAMRSRLRRQYPDLSPQEINLKVLEEIERVERRPAGLDAHP